MAEMDEKILREKAYDGNGSDEVSQDENPKKSEYLNDTTERRGSVAMNIIENPLKVGVESCTKVYLTGLAQSSTRSL